MDHADDDALTDRQVQILAAIKVALDDRGYPPTMREIGRAVGLSSPSSVKHQLEAMEAKGVIRRDPIRPRAMEIVDSPAARSAARRAERSATQGAALRGLTGGADTTSVEEALSDAQRSFAESSVPVPLVGRIAAGGPILAEQSVEDVFALPRQVVGAGDHFLLTVSGDSMVDAAICGGDWVVVRRQETAELGEVVAAMIEDEATVKVLARRNGHVWLDPRNEAYSPIPGDEASILGRVVAVIRSL